jgi:hypothetical protein
MWSSALIAVVICSLTLSLATRFCNLVSSSVHTAKAVDRQSVDPRRQHLNRDASRWFPPVVGATFLERIAVPLQIEPADPLLPTDTFYETLYNRPPPYGILL